MTTAARLAKTVLLQKNRHALQGLHCELGFDFEKPYFITLVHGHFTANSISKLLPKTEADTKTVLLIQPTTEKLCHNRLYCVGLVNHNTAFMVDRLTQGYKYDLDHFWGKGDFEDTRKNKTDFVIVISQNVEYLHPPKKQKNVNANERYILKYAQRATTSFKNGVEYFSSLELIPKMGDGEKITYKPFFNLGQKRTRDINDYIDKSGYIVALAREDLHRRARILKQQHEKEALLLADFSKEEELVYKKLDEAKKALCTAIMQAKNRDDACTVSKAENRFSSALWSLDYYNKTDFPNIQRKRDSLNQIREYLDCLFSALRGD